MKKILILACVCFFAEYAIAQRDTSYSVQKGLDCYAKEDYSCAYSIFLQAANHNNAYAQGLVGFLYENGYGVEKSDAMAVKW